MSHGSGVRQGTVEGWHVTHTGLDIGEERERPPYWVWSTRDRDTARNSYLERERAREGLIAGGEEVPTG